MGLLYTYVCIAVIRISVYSGAYMFEVLRINHAVAFLLSSFLPYFPLLAKGLKSVELKCQVSKEARTKGNLEVLFSYKISF